MKSTKKNLKDEAGDMPWSPPPSPQIDCGTVGWENEDTFYEMGTAANDGFTLVRVQLFRGRDFSKPLNESVGQGHKLLCHIPSGMFRIPKRGTRVWVAIPMGWENKPGGGVIIACAEKNPLGQYNADRAQINFGDDVDVVIRGKSVTLTDPGNRFITVGTPRGGGVPGIILQDETGSGGTITAGAVGWWAASGGTTTTLFQLTAGDATLAFNGSDGMSLVKLENGMITLLANTIQLPGGNMILGVGPVFIPLMMGAVAGMGFPSTSIFGTAV